MESYSVYMYIYIYSCIYIYIYTYWERLHGRKSEVLEPWAMEVGWFLLRSWNLGILVVTDGKEHGEHYSHYTLWSSNPVNRQLRLLDTRQSFAATNGWRLLYISNHRKKVARMVDTVSRRLIPCYRRWPQEAWEIGWKRSLPMYQRGGIQPLYLSPRTSINSTKTSGITTYSPTRHCHARHALVISPCISSCCEFGVV